MKKLFLTIMAIIAAGATIPAQDISSMIKSMTVEEKVAQIIIEAIDSQDDPERKAKYENWAAEGLGGLIVMDSKLKDDMMLINSLQTKAKIPMIVSIDGEWGASMRYREYTAFPKLMQMGALSDDSLVYEMGKAIGEELSEIKIFVNFAPDVDVNNNPDNPVINVRSFGEDRDKVAAFGSAFTRGMQRAGVYGSAKHFPGHGDTDVDSHKGLPVLLFDRNRLDSLELYPFRRLIADGVEMVMVGHLSVPALDASGTPASISKAIVTDVLRKELGFNGIIITDALQMKGVAEGNANAAFLAYKAGADILLMPQNVDETIAEISAAVEKGELSEEELDAKVHKMLDLKARCGMLDKSFSPTVDINTLDQKTNRPATEELIQKISDQTMTVVRGGNNLPLKIGNGKKAKTAYVAFNAVTPESAEFEKEIRKYGNVDRFDMPITATQAQIDSIGKLIRKYKKVIVGFHSGKPRPRTGGPRREADIDSLQFDSIAKWSENHDLYGFFLGNPYKLNYMPAHINFKTFIIGYSDSRHNNIAAARAIGKGGAKGVLPVAAGGYPCGHASTPEIEAARLYDILHPSADITPYSTAFTRNQVRTREDMKNHDHLDIPTYVCSTFSGFLRQGGELYSNRSGSLNNGNQSLDPVQIYANGVKVNWSFVSGMTVKDVENMYVLKGNEAALYQAYGGVVLLELRNRRTKE